MSQCIAFSVDSDGIATLLMDVPNRPMNVITPELQQELAALVEKVAGDSGIRGAILASAKSTSFLAGADLKGMDGLVAPDPDKQKVLESSSRYSKILRRLETCGKPFVAAIDGVALGGGLELALACHYRVVANESKCKLGLPEVLVGLLPGAGGTQRLPRLIGLEAALPLLIQGTHIDPDRARTIGLVHEVLPREQLLAAAKRWLLERGDPVQPWDRKDYRFPGPSGVFDPRSASLFAATTAQISGTTNHNYPAPLAITAAVYEGHQVPIDTALRIESRYFVELACDPVAGNMVRTLFVHKGAAEKLSARPAGVPHSPIRKLGVLGAGMMGAGIAHVAAVAGIEVVLLDREAALARQGAARSSDLLEARVKNGKLTQAEMQQILARIRSTDDYGDLADCDLVIEAVFEDRAVKDEVLAAAERQLRPDAVLASNTSSLPITSLAISVRHPERFIGVHFFSPVDRMPLIEVIKGARTADAALARSLDFVQQLRKIPIVVNDGRGFYTSRVFGTMINEGITLLREGVRPALIENAAKIAGFPVGPLAVADEVSLELAYKVALQTRKDLDSVYREAPSFPVIELMVTQLGRIGRKAGKGFYDYPADGPKRLWPGLAEHFPPLVEQPSLETVKRRLIYIQALEAVRCMEEGVVTQPADGDVGAIFGWGFPSYTGGPFSLIDTIGVQAFQHECRALAERHGERFTPPSLLATMARGSRRFHAG